jgi:hypothetical protein
MCIEATSLSVVRSLVSSNAGEDGSGSQNGKRDVARSRGGCPSAGGDVSLPSSAPGRITTPGFVDPNVSAAMKKNPFGNDPVIAVAATPRRRA